MTCHHDQMDAKRQQQLRDAKQRQRARDRDAGLGVYQVRLPGALVARLKAGMRQQDFTEALEAFLEHEVLDVQEYPNLKLLCWNRKSRYMTRRQAFALYERNWRLVSEAELVDEERRLIAELREEFGAGVINA